VADAAVAAAALLDGARRPLVRALVRIEPARRVFVVRERRVLAGALVAVAMSFAVAAWQPLIALWLGAALFGVPHVVSGIRHVAVREPLAPATRVLVLLAVVVGAVELCASGTRIADGAVRAYVLLFAAAIVVELGAGQALARVAVLEESALALVSPRLTLIVLAHVHGLGAVAWFVRRARARGVVVWPFVTAVVLVFAAGALGAFDALSATTLWAPRSAAASIVAEAAGTTVDGVLLRRALFLYAFGQALHFAVWLRLVPDLERPSKLPQTFRRALALFEADFGRAARALLVVCVASAPLILWGGGAAREAYFALTYFHVGLEAAALARTLAQSRARTA